MALTCADPPHQATHWTGRAMAEAAGISLSSVQRIWAGAQAAAASCPQLQALARPEFAAKLTDIVGLYMIRRSRRGAVDRREEPDPGARPHPAGTAAEAGRCGTMTHDYKRHGTTTLFAALNVLEAA